MIRPARTDDVDAILDLVRQLAAYERAEDEVVATAGSLRAALFGDSPAVFCSVAETGGRVVGFAVWFLNFSTWLGRHGIYLEDLYVEPAHRGAGHGLALLRELARTAETRGYGRLDWSVLDWNTPAVTFYRRLGAVPLDEWTVYRLTGDSLAALGAPTSR